MGFSRQEYWSGLPFPSPEDLPDPGIEPRSPTLQAGALTSEPPGKPSKQSQEFYNSNKHLCGTYNVGRWTTSWVQEQWQSPGLHLLNHLCKMQMCDSRCRFWSIYCSLNSMDNSKADPSIGTTDVTQSPHITGDWKGLIISDQLKQDSGLQAEEGEGGMNWESSIDIIHYHLEMQEMWVPSLGQDVKWSTGGRHGNPLQYSYLENPMDRGAWLVTVHGVAKSRMWLKQLSMR